MAMVIKYTASTTITTNYKNNSNGEKKRPQI